MMDGDDWNRNAPSDDVALEVLVRAYHALAVIYELSNPGAYAVLHGKMMPYLLDSFCQDAQNPAGPYPAETVATALERVRCALDDVRSDVAAVRDGADAGARKEAPIASRRRG
ncbi:hypothetical protein ABIE45_000332 [Methylobacterium sp. OAE515]|jgi:hypothetical protein|uniref:hypothetical protein n=1 Tax=Methylobacterium sp. OAE515 TaxID=2817895 RepID=UPI0019E41143